MQQGYIFSKGPSWFLGYSKRDPGKTKGWKWAVVRLCAHDDRFQSERSVRDGLKNEIRALLDPIDASGQNNSTQLLATFIEHVYLPRAEKELRPSTTSVYKLIFRKHIKPRLGDISIMDFRVVTGQRLMNQIAEEMQPQLSRASLKHIKHFLTGVFKFAAQEGIVDSNLMREVAIPKGKESKDTYAYNLDEIVAMLEALPEPTKTVIATAAFTGMRRSELRGLRWSDLKDGHLYVSRTVWGATIEERTKTKASKAGVPIIPILASYLESHKNGKDDGFIFAGPKLRRPLNLANVARRVIVPTLKKAKVDCWHGWHAFRRGLATNLHAMGTPDQEIQNILRHADISTTQRHYIKHDPETVRRSLERIGKAFATRRAKIRRKKNA